MFVDTTTNVTKFLPALKAKGVTHVSRYITHAGWVLKRPEAQAITAAGLKIIANFEDAGATPSAFSYAMGLANGRFARAYLANEIGAPPDAIMPFSTEARFDQAFITGNIFPYFDGVKAAMAEAKDYPAYGIAAYSSGSVLAALLDTSRIQLAWAANALGWQGTRAFIASNRWHFRQLPTVKNFVPGLDVDPDEINPTYTGPTGGFTIGPAATAGAAAGVASAAHPTLRKGDRGPDVKAMQTLLAANVGGWWLQGLDPVVADGVFGPKTEAAVKAFQTAAGLTSDAVVGADTWAKLQVPA